jgi:glucuronate isomerase
MSKGKGRKTKSKGRRGEEMKDDKFLGPNWLLDTKEAVRVFHDVAVPFRRQVGILDTHTHHNLRQIVENQPFPNIWRAEVLEDREEYANNDHYIIQLAAKCPGFSQALARDPQIPDFDKWMALSRVFPRMEGNHVHQWLHLNLRRLFGIRLLLSEKTGEKIWNLTSEHFRERSMRPQAVLQRARARVICTTDDPGDDLQYHSRAAKIEGIRFIPTFRPDAYVNIFSESWRSHVSRLLQKTRKNPTLQGLMEALGERHEYFARRGAKASDHGLLEPYGLEVKQKRAEAIFRAAYDGKKEFALRSPETAEFISFLMHFFCGMNQERRMVTQIHYGAFRNANRYLLEKWGPDVGGDIVMDRVKIVENITPLLSRFFDGRNPGQSHLVLYPMNQTFANVNLMLERAFPNIHAGFPWWHNDTPYVMEDYLLHTAGASLLTSSGGPVCDGRKILSEESRFEVFDRVICRAMGKLATDGQVSRAGGTRLIKALMYENQAKLFRLT